MSLSIKPNRNDFDIVSGIELPPLLQAETPSSALVILDSKDRTYGSVSDFRCDLYRNIVRPRYIELTRCNIPKCNNVNLNNHTIQITHDLGTTAPFTLDQGIYNSTSLANELTNKINIALSAVPIADSVTTTYDPNTRTFSIQSVGGHQWYFHSECSFIQYGKFLAPFESLPAGSATANVTNLSGISCLLYTRYLVIQSSALSQNIYSSGASSLGSQALSMIATIDLTGIYKPEDFDVSVPFAGVMSSMPVDGMKISVINTQRQLPRDIDIKIVDEYGLLYENALDLGGSYPSNELGLSFFFLVTF